MPTKRLLPLTAVGLALTFAGCTLDRPDDPVVLTGANVPTLSSVAAGDVVAFRWVNGWTQLPVQVDERKQVNFTQVYNNAYSANFTTTVYADAGTFTGTDTDPNVDADDEIAFMARDTGLEAPGDAGVPANVVAGSGVKLRVRSTLSGTKDAWVYLFKRSGAISPGAGQKYVDYTFSLTSGDYKTTYKLAAGPNPENSTITTPYYSTHFSDRWLRDQLTVKAGNATGVDILDRAKARLAPGNCGRSEDTFNAGEGAFIANKSGPVRAIRSYIGANSGPVTQREHVFYERREDVRTFLRVHAVPGAARLLRLLGRRQRDDIQEHEQHRRRHHQRHARLGDGRTRSPGRAWTVPRAASRWRTRWTPTSPGWPPRPTTWTTARRPRPVRRRSARATTRRSARADRGAARPRSRTPTRGRPRSTS